MPILALPFQGGIESRERAFHMGADDFMEKPLELRECLVRAQALLRRYNAAAPSTTGGSWSCPAGSLTCCACGLPRGGLTPEQLRYYVWKDDFAGDENKAIPVSVSRLR